MVLVPDQLLQLDYFFLLLDTRLLSRDLVTQALSLLDVHAIFLGCLQTSFNLFNFLLCSFKVLLVLLSLTATFFREAVGLRNLSVAGQF